MTGAEQVRSSDFMRTAGWKVVDGYDGRAAGACPQVNRESAVREKCGCYGHYRICNINWRSPRRTSRNRISFRPAISLSSSRLRTLMRLTAITTSPDRRPRCAAALPGSTLVTSMPPLPVVVSAANCAPVSPGWISSPVLCVSVRSH
jgi:hypothetical protein